MDDDGPGPAQNRRGRGRHAPNRNRGNDGYAWRNQANQRHVPPNGNQQHGNRQHGNQQHDNPQHGHQQHGYQQHGNQHHGNQQRGQPRRGQGFHRQDEIPQGFRPRQDAAPGNENHDENGRNDREQNRNGANRNNKRQQNRDRVMGFRALEEMVLNTDVNDIITKLNERKESFTNLLESNIDNDKCDMFVLIMEIISKVCKSTFDQLKLNILLDICNSRFNGNLCIYFIDLPYMERKERNRLYWNKPAEFWANFITFCECIMNLSPATALQKCRKLIDSTSKLCLEGLREKHGFVLSDEQNAKLLELRERLLFCEKEDKKEDTRQNYEVKSVAEDSEPPDDFRQLSVVPRRDDLLDKHPFYRANIVKGGYRDVDHYLDVQFRLLREDCFGPLRDGINQYMEDPKRKKFDNIRVYQNVKFVEPYITKTKIGSMAQLDEKTVKKFKKVNWAHSKRFIFGSLLLFTKDNCKSFITATILDRDVNFMSKGKIPLYIVDAAVDADVTKFGDSYVMIESEVYFEPYFHVLKALQDPTFPNHLAMRKYIVNVDPVPNHPAYIKPDILFAVQTEYARTKFTVLRDETWPTKEELGLNDSQYKAYKLALTHEFAVIQGPPGTGKTFLGVKIARTLLENLTIPPKTCLMLVICYTNHALDQFLEAILPITRSIVRIGGQSRNETMEKINITTLRKTSNVHRSSANKVFYEQKQHLSVLALQFAQERLESVTNGVIGYNSLIDYVPECEKLRQYYSTNRIGNGDPLKYWLFENMNHVDFNDVLVEEPEQQNIVNDVDEDINERIEFIMDDFEDDMDFNLRIDDNDAPINMSLSVKDIEKKLQTLISLYKKTNVIQHKQQLQTEIVDLKSRINLFNEMAENRDLDIQLNIDRVNLARLTMIDRWSLYFRWANVVMNDLKTRMKPLEEELQSANNAYDEARMIVDLDLLRGIKVVGMTTTGAARLRKLLQALAPKIVIVEEAAEVLEQHIVTSLNKDCQHVILIGDHKQLRPSAAHIKLARECNIEISLFERMITNGMHSRRLSVQHRMRPEIASLISPHIYSDLENHPTVQSFPNVRGMTDNLFFMTHNYMEDEVEDSASKSNHREADLTLRLANYLMQQGYQPEDITILSAYSGQMFYMRKQREKYAALEKVKMTVVDNYQGEESKIILLSLVRNNKENKIGFLGTENRICVALSRAREGFYIFGNIDILKRKSPLWQNIATTLSDNASLGSALMLQCENHQSQITTISSPKDFDKVPEGGCLLKCNYNLPCQHPCPRVCHGYDRGHVNTKCFMKCERVLCELGHVCPLICWVKCQPCKRLVSKMLPCGHTMLVYCYQEPADPDVKCLTTVTVTLPSCKHEVKKSCFMKTADVKCTVRCVFRVNCGHECRLKCHVNDDPDHERYLCEKPCAEAKKGCTAGLVGDRGNHQCSNKCHQVCDDCTVEVVKKRSTCKHSERVPCNVNVDDSPCRKNCARTLTCGHFCKKKCFEPCGDCMQKVKKVIPDCNHEVEVICMVEPCRTLCKRKCERKLLCGHPCKDTCDKLCDPAKCTVPTGHEFTSPCGHKVMLPCNVYRSLSGTSPVKPEILLKHCKEPCMQTLECEHACAGTCAQCYQGRLHAACTQTCHQTNICGHQCLEPCNQVCPPCKIPCEIRCPHSHCNGLCGAPCVPCKEKCTRACPHGACTRRCGEPCSRPPCDEPCAKRLACGHPCRGLCGEPCPDICKLCRPDDFPTDFLGYDFEDDDKFVKLQDCSHVLEVENMDNLMTGDKEAVAIRSCPFCRKPILNTYRYKDLVNGMLKNEINPIKERVYGTQAKIQTKKGELFLKVVGFYGQHEKILEENLHWKKACDSLCAVIKTQKNVSMLKLEMQFQYLNILDMIGECYKKYKQGKSGKLENEFHELIKTICRVLMANIQKISLQLQKDIGNEMKRMNAIIQLSKILNHPSYKSSLTATQVVRAAEVARTSVLTWSIYKEEDALTAMKSLQEAVNVSGIVAEEERELIVRAIGSKAGSWYKCPNGHFYTIANCGQAVQVSRCVDCGVGVGGRNYSLLPGNRRAMPM